MEQKEYENSSEKKLENVSKKMLAFFEDDLSDRRWRKHHLYDIKEAWSFDKFNRDLQAKIKEFLLKSTVDENFWKEILYVLSTRDFDDIDDGVKEEVMEEYNKAFNEAYLAFSDAWFDTQQVKTEYYTDYFGRHGSEDILELLQSKYKEYSNQKDSTWKLPPLIKVVNFDGKTGYIDSKTHEEIIPCIYDEYSNDFSEWFALVWLDDGYFFIDEKWNKIFWPFEEWDDFEEGLASVKKNDLRLFINKKWEMMFDKTFKQKPRLKNWYVTLSPAADSIYLKKDQNHVTIMNYNSQMIELPENMNYPRGILSSKDFIKNDVVVLIKEDQKMTLRWNILYLFDIRNNILVCEYTYPSELSLDDINIEYIENTSLLCTKFLEKGTRNWNLIIFNREGKKIIEEKWISTDFRKEEVTGNEDWTIKIDIPGFNWTYRYDTEKQKLINILN